MKLWFPISGDDFNYTNEYINYCESRLSEFKILLRNKLNVSKLNSRKDGLLNSKNIRWLPTTINFKLTSITDMYIRRLHCELDKNSNRCYYTVHNGVKCPGTETSLNTVIKIIEFGNELVPPMNWIRHTYQEFVETIKTITKTNF